jgi:hypothetical protein
MSWRIMDMSKFECACGARALYHFTSRCQAMALAAL